jgi:hypothetical protein
MKNRIIATTGLIALIASTSAFSALAQGTSPIVTPIVTPISGGKALMERHPELRKADRELEAALKTLQSASHDFSGHREAAMDLTSKAIAQVKLALQSDKH